MTRHETFATLDIAEKDLVLATDLDGTFLGGSQEDRDQFYDWINTNRHRVGLIFVTGRDPGFITAQVRKGLPDPDYVIGDVGTTIARFGADRQVDPIAELEAEIAAGWGDATNSVDVALRRFPGLKLQSGLFRHRASFDMDPHNFHPEAVKVVEEMGFDALISDDRFFDVLPKGVSKGPSLLRLLSHLGIQNSRTLVAGDTLNDLSMLELGLPAVAVGGSEQALIEKVKGLDHLHCAEGVGVSGIAEAILHFDFFKKSNA
ncbi:MAG: HAD-IIB family hydrolase [Pseudomonadota bacterium]